MEDIEGSIKSRNKQKADDDFEAEEVKGEETAVAAYNEALIVPPSNPPKLNSNAPKANYKPNYVYGYRGYDSRQNLFFNKEGKLVYPLAALGIIMDPKTNTQTFFGGQPLGKTSNQHDDNIICLAVSHDRKKVATGQTGTKPKLFIWDAITNAYTGKYVLTDKNSKAVVACAFSTDGAYIALVDLSPEHTVYVVDGKTGKLLWKKNSGPSIIYGICWSSGKDFVTCGTKTIKFWNMDKQQGVEGTGFDEEIMSCVAFDEKGNCHVSSTSGNVYVFNETKVVQKIKPHKSKINSMMIYDKIMITAGDDKRVLITEVGSYKTITEIKCKEIPRAADMIGNLVAVGDLNGGITLYKDGAEVDSWLGHHEGEVWGIDLIDNHIITTGDDNKVILWDYNKRKAVQVACINKKPGQKLKDNVPSKLKGPDNQSSRAVCYNPASKEVAISTSNGELHIRDIGSIDKDKKVISCSKRWIECMCYSPKGDMLAVGTHANELFVYSVPEYELKANLEGHSTPLICIDWSVDESYLRSLDEGFDLLFWQLPKFSNDAKGAENTKDMDWATQSCKVGWSVLGIYPPGVAKTHVNYAVKSRDGKLLATGDDWGFVNLYNFPCGKGAKSVSLRGHSEQVPRIVFSNDDEYIFSVGGNDKAVIQWKK
jgi:WD40 repeat protein